MSENMLSREYSELLDKIKDRIRSAQYEALKAVNLELITLYWDIGKTIIEQQRGDVWGKSIVNALEKDLHSAIESSDNLMSPAVLPW